MELSLVVYMHLPLNCLAQGQQDSKLSVKVAGSGCIYWDFLNILLENCSEEWGEIILNQFWKKMLKKNKNIWN